MIDVDIVDCHHHLWDLQNSYPWLQETAGELQVHGDDTAIRRDYLVADLRRDAGELPLVGSVHVDAGAADGWAESQWLQAVGDEYGLPQAIVAGAHLDDPTVDELLERLATLPNARGVRDILNWHPDPTLSYIDRDDLMTDPQWRKGFGRLSGYGFSFDLQVYPDQLAAAAALAADFPSTAIALNHAGMPLDRSDDGMTLWRGGLKAMAAQDNVQVKISGIGMTDHRWTTDSIRPVVAHCIETFGVHRSMFGSNFPVDSLYSDYQQVYSAFDDITQELFPNERAAIFGGTAGRFYRI
jgi:predicted TIM-barrel fold metal-dependent hydrolase